MSKRLQATLEKYFRERERFEGEKVMFYKTLLILGMSLSFMFLRLLLIYLILKQIDMGPLGWTIFWMQVPFFLALDFLEKFVYKSGHTEG